MVTLENKPSYSPRKIFEFDQEILLTGNIHLGLQQTNVFVGNLCTICINQNSAWQCIAREFSMFSWMPLTWFNILSFTRRDWTLHLQKLYTNETVQRPSWNMSTVIDVLVVTWKDMSITVQVQSRLEFVQRGWKFLALINISCRHRLIGTVRADYLIDSRDQ